MKRTRVAQVLLVLGALAVFYYSNQTAGDEAFNHRTPDLTLHLLEIGAGVLLIAVAAYLQARSVINRR